VEKGGLARALGAVGLTAGDTVMAADELRLGLHGQVRRVRAPTGVKVVQRRQIAYRWRYLLLGVDPRAGTLRWQWLDRFRQEQLQPVLAAWGLDAILWDGAGAHRGKQLRELPTVRLYCPPYSPELTPVERVFEEIRRRVEGRVYPDLDAKQAVVETYLQELAADPPRVQQLCGWAWLLDAFATLPPAAESAPATTG
jgi:DDE superfamily endonuclease